MNNFYLSGTILNTYSIYVRVVESMYYFLSHEGKIEKEGLYVSQDKAWVPDLSTFNQFYKKGREF